MQAQYSCFGQDGRDIQQREDPVQNAQTKGYLFPSDVYLSPEGGGNYTEEVVIGADKVLGTAPLYRYYYMAENVTEGTDSGERTRLQIKAKKGGAEYTKAIDLDIYLSTMEGKLKH